jgi:hypothetical protein
MILILRCAVRRFVFTLVRRSARSTVNPLVIPSRLPQRCAPDAADGITPFFMGGDACSKGRLWEGNWRKYAQFEVYHP